MPRPDRRRSGPDTTPDRPNAESPSSTDTASVTDLAAWRELRAWRAAVLWLHGLGLPAAVPCDVDQWLRARGVEADWYHRGPCGCGSDGCWVLHVDDEKPWPEIHCQERAT